VKVVLAGASGLIGRPLEASLRADGHDVPRRLLDAGFGFAHADLAAALQAELR